MSDEKNKTAQLSGFYILAQLILPADSSPINDEL
jgi:hypothetical protein